MPNPFITGGGFNCRHQWVLVAPEKVKEPHRQEVVPSRDAIERAGRSQEVILERIDDKSSKLAAVKNKKAVAERLARRMADHDAFRALARELHTGEFSQEDPVEDACAFLVHQWARTSANENVYSLAMQLAAEEEFGLARWRPFRKRTKWRAARKFYGQHGVALRAFVRAQYNETQQYLRDRGIESMYLFRGMRESKGLNALLRHPEKKMLTARHKVSLQPMSSFSEDFNTSLLFTGSKGTMLGAEIPAGRILSICRTGFGCVDEVEAVVLSGPGQFWEVCWNGPEWPTLQDFAAAIRGAK